MKIKPLLIVFAVKDPQGIKVLAGSCIYTETEIAAFFV